MQTEMLNPQNSKIMQLKNLKPLVEKQMQHEMFFQDHLQVLYSMPKQMKRKALARSKRRLHLLSSLAELL